MKVLIIEDDKVLSDTIKQCVSEQYDTEQEYDGYSGYIVAKQKLFDIIILDLMLPELDGYEVLKKLREDKIFTPVLILTAKDGIADKVKGFRVGADDYLTKPFQSDELLVRMEAIIRRAKGVYEIRKLKFKDLEINLDSRTVYIGSNEVILQGKQFEMLEYLVNSKNTIITKEQIFDKIWGFNSDTTANVVEVYASAIRKALKDYGYDQYLKTVRRSGVYASRIGGNMDEQKVITKNLIKNTLINFFIFAIILIIFDLIIYNRVSVSLLKNVDEQLTESKDKIVQAAMPDYAMDRREDRELRDEDFETLEEVDNEISPRVINIVRNSSGEIENEEELGSLADYAGQLGFSVNNLERTYTVNISNKYTYRAINFKIMQDDEVKYMQVLINIDGEAETLESMAGILLIGTVILVCISMIISYALSKRSIKPLIEAYKTQTEFVQNASHELRTPLTIIQAKQELLLKNPESKIIEKSEEINLSLQETKRLTKLIKELMDLARADEGNYNLNKENVEIDTLIKEVVQPYEEIAKMQEKDMKLDLNFKGSINCDKNKIVELLVIILDNAIKYTAEGEQIKIETQKKDRHCTIKISDTGIGVSDEDLKHIFDRFYRADKARTKETGGTGLGLSIAKTIVNLHGGEILAEHNKPKGLSIIIKL